uniref:ATP-dependent helicase n=1 Tax=Pithovirus LCPAC101 TaxID=2506586 RepID=A0A481Z476_9VIRU|nr:MAG: ATP-dependent helicase [Pithovirus LCPAC101]
MEPLLVDNYLNNIIKIIRIYPQTLLVSPEGSGLELGLPASLANESSERYPNGYRVIVSVPNIDSALGLYNHALARFPSINVGYADNENVSYDENTKIIYATSDHVNSLIINAYRDGKSRNWQDESGSQYQILILGSYNNMSSKDYLSYLLWKDTLKQAVSAPKGSKNISFPHLVLVSPEPVPVDKTIAQAKIPITHHPISIKYQSRSYPPTSIDLFNDAASLAINNFNSEEKGHVLIYLTTQDHVPKMLDSLKRYISRSRSGMGNKIFIHDRHTSPNDYLEIHNSTDKYIILTTDNMNSSLTMINIGSVIDLMSEEIVYGHDNRIINETKSLANTRTKRGGRMFSSSCVRMTQSYIFDRFSDTREPDIKRTPLDIIILQMLNKRIIINDIFSDSKYIGKDELLETVSKLKVLKCIDEKNNVTEIGRFVLSLTYNTDIQNKVMLYYWINFIPEHIYEGILIVSLIHNYGASYFYTPPYNSRNYRTPYEYNLSMNDHMRMHLSAFLGKSEIETSLNIWQSIFSNNISINDVNIEKYIIQFSRKYSMNNVQLKKALYTLKSLIIDVGRITEKRIIENNQYNASSLLDLLRPIARISYSARVMTIYKKGNNNNVKYTEKNTNNIFSTTLNTPLNTYLFDNPPMVVAFHTQFKNSQNGINKTIMMGLDIPSDKLDLVDLQNISKYVILKSNQPQKRYGSRPQYDNLKVISHTLPDINTESILHREHTLKNDNYSLYTDITKDKLIKTM